MSSRDLRTNEELCVAYQNGDPDALAVLCSKNEDYLIALATRLHNTYPDALAEVEDLVSEGYIGLARAAASFKERHGARFTTYAYLWIMKYMRKLFYQGYDKEHEVLHAEDIYKIPSSVEWEDLVIRMNMDTAPQAFRRLTIQSVRHALSRLRPREREYMEYKYGIDTEIEVYRSDAAEYFHIRTRRAEELEKKAIRNLKQELVKEKLLYYDVPVQDKGSNNPSDLVE